MMKHIDNLCLFASKIARQGLEETAAGESMLKVARYLIILIPSYVIVRLFGIRDVIPKNCGCINVLEKKHGRLEERCILLCTRRNTEEKEGGYMFDDPFCTDCGDWGHEAGTKDCPMEMGD
jgi:hypothetical protein